ncbi:hypothetical protein BIY24_06715 [Halobacteriovorax marinus]|uniref:hypothetical protein n=1 Tax=Halobacteriovorax marinus TaxID=97084 RepID=UPI000BC34F88|nr:hypothetical protein [Halobacteriovorax marinus]ATH07645.1 hypothetical protein BIY24_06715 [Halobacteriovorax marinus]
MKKSNSKHLKVLALLSLSLSMQSFSAEFLSYPPGMTQENESVKGELYGPEITNCQVMSDGWKQGKPDFSDYTKREMGKAAKELNEEVEDMARNLPNFLNGKPLNQFIDLDTGNLREGYVSYFGNLNGSSVSIIPTSSVQELQNELDRQGVSYRNECPSQSNINVITSECIVSDNQGSSITSHTIVSLRSEEAEDLKSKIPGLVQSYRESLTEIVKDVARCSALYSVVSNGKSARGMEYSDYNKTQSAKSFDGKLKCSSLGYETQDYKACKDATTFYDAVFVGRKAVETAQGFQYMDKSMDIQTDMAKNAQTDATAGLKAQKEDIQTKAEMARTRAATETAAVGALWAAMEKIPDLEEITDECRVQMNHYSKTREMDNFSNAFSSYYKKTLEDKIGLKIDNAQGVQPASVLIENEFNGACGTHVGNTQTASHALIQNSEAKGVIQQALIDAGMNIATMLGTAEILDKQAGRVGDAIKLVEDHNPESLAYTGEDVAVTECQVNPNSENCVSAQYERGVGYHNDGISVSGMQFATSDSTLPTDDTAIRNTDGAGDSTDRGSSVGGIGAPIDPVGKGSGLADDPVAAASVAATGSNGIGAGGGGGGGGGASGGASAPANGSARTGGQGANKPYVGSSKKLKYSSGGGLSFSSGSKRRVASKSKAENPFSKLFGKKNGNKNGVLNFRGVASDVGSKNGSIFQMISKRYSAVNKDNRLQEYTKK